MNQYEKLMISMSMKKSLSKTGILFGCMCFFAGGTSTAHSDPYTEPAPSFSEGRSLTVGGGVVVRPKYEGSDEYEAIGFPLIIPNLSASDQQSPFGRFAKRVSFHGIDDIRFRAVEWNAIEVGPVVGFRGGRDEDDAARLRGLGDIDDGLAVGGYVGLRLANVLFDASATTQVTGDDTGAIVRFSGQVEQELTETLSLTGRLGTTFASDDYNQTFFGLTPVQAARSQAGLGVFETDAGFKDVFVDLNAKLDLTDRWRLQLGGRYTRLIGDAADSPIIDTEDQFSARLAIGYKFYLDR